MTDPADVEIEATETIGPIELQAAPVAGGKIHLTARRNGDVLESADYSRKIFSEMSIRGQFLNSVTESLEGTDVDPEATRSLLNQWFAEKNDEYQEESGALLPDHIRQVRDSVESVEIYGGDPTKVVVTLTWKGKIRELDFTADEFNEGGAKLVSHMANQFFEFGFDCGSEEWDAIRSKWEDMAEVAGYIDETAEDTHASRLLEYLSHDVVPVSEKADLENNPHSAWVDPENRTGTPLAPPDAPIVWVENTFIMDTLERVGMDVGKLGQIIQNLDKRGAIYGTKDEARKRWPNSQGKDRAKFYAFRPDALGVDPDDFAGDNEPAHGEVAP